MGIFDCTPARRDASGLWIVDWGAGKANIEYRTEKCRISKEGEKRISNIELRNVEFRSVESGKENPDESGRISNPGAPGSNIEGFWWGGVVINREA